MRVVKPEDQRRLSRAVIQTSLAETWPVQTSTTPYQLSFRSHTAVRLLAVFCYGRHGNYDTTSVTLGQVAFNQDNELRSRVKIADIAEKTIQVQLHGKQFLEEIHLLTYLLDGFGGRVVSMLASGSRVRGFDPHRSRWIFSDVKQSSACLSSEGK
jgi:hypothetical protein